MSIIDRIKRALPDGYRIYKRSIQEKGGEIFALVKSPAGEKLLYVMGERPVPEGMRCKEGLGEGLLCLLTPQNAFALQKIFDWLKPRTIGVNRPSFGFGDRLGLATPGHVRAIRGRAIIPVFAQQSIREMERTGRTPEEVMADAIWGVFQEGYTGGFGADADHLKTIADIERTVPVGFTLYTCDPSDYVNDRATLMDATELEREFVNIPGHEELRQRYLGQTFELCDLKTEKILTIELSEEELGRAAVKYGKAVQWAITIYQALKDRLREFDFELSVDETETPTTPVEHLFIVNELKRAGVKLTGLAPRFVGEFQKGVDYIGDLNALKRQLQAHATIARSLGPYKISVHSGSDKFRIYPLIHRHLDNLFHIKTAGTSYLVAVYLLALEEPELFREIYRFALSRYDEDRETYHVTRHPILPDVTAIPDDGLPKLLEQDDVRQLLHVSFGSVLTWRDREGGWLFRQRLLKALEEYEEHYYELLERHFRRHLDLLE